nr:unnamed protein product [Spirometra erinaceieuropaei]
MVKFFIIFNNRRQLKGVLDHLKSIKAFTLACEQAEKSHAGEEKDRLSESVSQLANLSSELALKTAAWLSTVTSGEEMNAAIHNFPSCTQDIQCSGNCDMDETQLIAEAGSSSGLTTILSALCALDGEIKRLPVLIEDSVAKQKIDILMNFVTEEVLES